MKKNKDDEKTGESMGLSGNLIVLPTEDRAVTQEPEELDLEAIRDFGGVILTPAETDQVSAYYYAMVAEVERLRKELAIEEAAGHVVRLVLNECTAEKETLTCAIAALRGEMEEEAQDCLNNEADRIGRTIQRWAEKLKALSV